MGVCWQSTGDSSKSKQSRLTNQIITASQRQSTINRHNENIQKEPDKNELITHIEPKNNINYNLNSSFEESVKMFPDMTEWGNGINKANAWI